MTLFFSIKGLADWSNPFHESVPFIPASLPAAQPDIAAVAHTVAANRIREAAVNIPGNLPPNAAKMPKYPVCEDLGAIWRDPGSPPSSDGIVKRYLLDPFNNLPELERRWLLLMGEMHPATIHPPFRNPPSAADGSRDAMPVKSPASKDETVSPFR